MGARIVAIASAYSPHRGCSRVRLRGRANHRNGVEDPMKCKRCGASVEVTRENYDYSSVGLPVTLCDVQVRSCRECGDRGAGIPNVEGLHRAIAMAVIRKPARFTGKEIRFLRKSWGGRALTSRSQLG